MYVCMYVHCMYAEEWKLSKMVLMCGCALPVMLLKLAVVLPPPHNYCGLTLCITRSSQYIAAITHTLGTYVHMYVYA